MNKARTLRYTGALTAHDPSLLIRVLQWLLFAIVVKRRPVDDDVERAFCTVVEVDYGIPGHTYCGWCPNCARPRTTCTCEIMY